MATEFDQWFNQMSQQLYFFALGSTDDTFVNRFSTLSDTWTAYQRGVDNSISILFEATRDVLQDYILALENNQWLGYNSPLLVEDTLLKTNYFYEKLRGVIFTEEENIRFWNRLNIDNINLTVTFLDPRETELIDIARRLRKKYEQLEEGGYFTEIERARSLADDAHKLYLRIQTNQPQGTYDPQFIQLKLQEIDMGKNTL